MDKAGILIAVAITAAAVAFTATGGIGIESGVTPSADKEFVPTSQLKLEAQIAKKAAEDIQELSKDIEERTEKIQEVTKETVGAKLPAKFVSIPKGTSVPGCEEVDLCYDPKDVTIFVGGAIIWRNDDSAAHTITSGLVLTGPDGNFDSGLILPEETFSTIFDQSGEYPYFCMIHPWATGSVSVE